MKNLQSLRLDGCQLSGHLPQNWSPTLPLNTFTLDDNFLSGPLPKSIGQLSDLFIMRFDNNLFSGEIPDTWGNLTVSEMVKLPYFMSSLYFSDLIFLPPKQFLQ